MSFTLFTVTLFLEDGHCLSFCDTIIRFPISWRTSCKCNQKSSYLTFRSLCVVLILGQCVSQISPTWWTSIICTATGLVRPDFRGPLMAGLTEFQCMWRSIFLYFNMIRKPVFKEKQLDEEGPCHCKKDEISELVSRLFSCYIGYSVGTGDWKQAQVAFFRLYLQSAVT